MNTLIQDLRYGARMLLRRPGFAAIAALTLALGIGANTAIFTVVNAVLIRPLPFPESENLVLLNEYNSQMQMSVAYPNFADWRDQNKSFEKIGVYNRGSYNLVGSGEPERIQAARMSADGFSALRVNAAIGRVFGNDEDKPGAEPVVLLSHGLWLRRFGGNAGIVNQTISLNNRTFTVIGVMPEGFLFPGRVDMWVPVAPLSDDPNWRNRGNHPGLTGIARLKPGVSIDQARSDMESVALGLEKQFPDSNQGSRVRIRPLKEVSVQNVGTALWLMLGAVGIVLLIACANVANLLLARAAVRRRELAIRAALGADRWRVIRQLLTESVLLSLCGGIAGIVIAKWGVDLLLKLFPDSLPRSTEISLDVRVLIFTLVVSVFTGLIFGLAPALQGSHNDLHDALKESERGSTGGRHWLRKGLIVIEVALTLILLVGAGLLIRSFYRLLQVDPGFTYERVLSFNVSLPERGYDTLDRRKAFYQDLGNRLRSLPGVQSAAYSSGLPLGNNGWQTSFIIEGRPEPPRGQVPLMEACLVSPDYFKTMDIRLKSGRWFTEQDNRDHLAGTDLSTLNEQQRESRGWNVIVIDEEFARRYWPNEEAVGNHIRLGGGRNGPLLQVIGVVSRVRMEDLETDSNRVQGYLPFLQLPFGGMTVIARTSGDPEALIASVRREVQSVDPNQPIYDVRTLSEIRSQTLAPDRLNLILLTVFAGLATLLAVVGVYGVMSYMVSGRTQEIGIRMALGAQSRDVVRLVVREGMILALAGVALGLGSALALTRLMTTLLFGVKANDPLTFISITILLVAVALLACWVPARRASRVDPMIALRCE